MPSAAAGPEILADWLELRAIDAADGYMSIADLVQALRAAGTADDIDQDEGEEESDAHHRRPLTGSERSQSFAEDAFSEIERRAHVCGSPNAYPFRVFRDSIRVRKGYDNTLYVFLLLLSHFCEGDAAALAAFEDLSAYASSVYFGAPHPSVKRLAFGFPRRYLPKGFAAAVNDLCQQLGEGEGYLASPVGSRQKDGKLDVVVWRGFADGREGKLIGFGQCTTGLSGWKAKLPELQPHAFIDTFMVRAPAVPAMKMFFVPWRSPEASWSYDSRTAGIVFDRCRLVELGNKPPLTLRKQYQTWTGMKLKRLRQHQ